MWRKYWGEVRWLALYSAAGLIILTLVAVGDPSRASMPSRPELAFLEYNGPFLEIMLPTMIIGCALLLGIGGLGHERSTGTALFTLSLPVTRRSAITGRFVAGAAMIVALSLGAEMGIAIIAAFQGYGGQFSALRAVATSIYLTAGALAIYAFTFLAANVTAHTVRTIATVTTILIVISFAVGSPYSAHELHSAGWWLQPVDFLRLMGAGGYLRTGQLSWLGVLIAGGITVGLLEVTIRWVERFDF